MKIANFIKRVYSGCRTGILFLEQRLHYKFNEREFCTCDAHNGASITWYC